MTRGCNPVRKDRIADIRLRRGWFGRLVVQVKYALSECIPTPPGRPTVWREAGYSTWKDANANDIAELVELVDLMRGVSEGVDTHATVNSKGQDDDAKQR